MKPPSSPSSSQGITARTPDQFARKSVHNGPQPGKYDYFAQPESFSRSGAWEFFTEDELRRRKPTSFRPLLANSVCHKSAQSEVRSRLSARFEASNGVPLR